MATDFSWTPPLAVLVVGAVAGALVVAVRSRAKAGRLAAGSAAAATADLSQASDLQRRYDALIRRLAEGVDPEERAAIEVEAAQVLREIETGVASRTASEFPKESRTATEARPASAWVGFMYGVLVMGALGGLVFFASQGSSPRPEGGSPTGGNTMGSATSAAPPPETDEAALASLEAAVRNTPADIPQRVALTRAYMQRRDLMKVFDQTKAILELEPGQPHGLTYQALVRVAMGQAAQAETMLVEAIRKDPKIEDAYIHLALARIQLGNRKGAEDAIKEAQQQFPADKEQLAQVFAQISRAAEEKNAATSPAEDPHPEHAIPPPQGSGDPSAGSSVVVVVDVPKGVTVPQGAILFVIVREAGFETGPPVAVKRIPALTFPLTVTLTEKDSMAGESLPGLVRIDARVDRDGDPLTKDPRDPVASEDNVRVGSGQTLLVLTPPVPKKN